eukprot:gene338-biopygen142
MNATERCVLLSNGRVHPRSTTRWHAEAVTLKDDGVGYYHVRGKCFDFSNGFRFLLRFAQVLIVLYFASALRNIGHFSCVWRNAQCFLVLLFARRVVQFGLCPEVRASRIMFLRCLIFKIQNVLINLRRGKGQLQDCFLKGCDPRGARPFWRNSFFPLQGEVVTKVKHHDAKDNDHGHPEGHAAEGGHGGHGKGILFRPIGYILGFILTCTNSSHADGVEQQEMSLSLRLSLVAGGGDLSTFLLRALLVVMLVCYLASALVGALHHRHGDRCRVAFGHGTAGSRLWQDC